MLTRQRFLEGLTVQQYLDQMTVNKQRFLQALAEIRIRPEDRAALGERKGPLHILVLTEDWCGDAVTNFPVLVKLVEGLPDVELRVFLRDRNPDLMDRYLNQGMFRSIPVFVFLDEHMQELGRFVERPASVTEYIERRQIELRRQLREEKREEWRQACVDEIRTLLSP
jgi:hypothetical protein